MATRHALRAALVFALLVTVGGCCSARRKPAANLADDPEQFIVDPDQYQKLVQTQATTRGSAPHRILVLSGGGSNGAWGAGFLNGWSESHHRPTFDVVTGVSTGALISTGAFVGDMKLLKDAYTTTTNKDVQNPRPLLWAVLFSNALNDTAPLKKLIAKYFNDVALKKVADGGDHGRKLFVATVNLDSGKLAIWDLTAIAQAGKYDLFRDVVRASAAAPPLYPPVEIGNALHCDGGVRASLFVEQYLVPAISPRLASVESFRAAATMPTTRRAPATLVDADPSHVYVINNGKIGLGEQTTENCLKPIGLRAVSCLLNQNGVDSILKARLAAKDAGYDFHLSYIPDDVNELESFDFNPPDMTRLFDAGFAKGRLNDRWEDENIAPKLKRVYQQRKPSMRATSQPAQ
jgi:Patatin-like phospholipase